MMRHACRSRKTTASGAAFGSYTDQDSTDGSLGYQARSWTFQTGIQRRVAQDWCVGGL